MPVDIGDEVVGGIKSFLKKAGKGVAKAAVKTDKVVTTNPIARSLISNVPGGAAALSASDYGKNLAKVIAAAKSGNPKGKEAIEELKKEAAGGNKQAIDALAAMKNVNDDSKKPPKKGSYYVRAVRMGVSPTVWGA